MFYSISYFLCVSSLFSKSSLLLTHHNEMGDALHIMCSLYSIATTNSWSIFLATFTKYTSDNGQCLRQHCHWPLDIHKTLPLVAEVACTALHTNFDVRFQLLNSAAGAVQTGLTSPICVFFSSLTSVSSAPECRLIFHGLTRSQHEPNQARHPFVGFLVFQLVNHLLSSATGY
jgi:hypothetical protein